MAGKAALTPQIATSPERLGQWCDDCRLPSVVEQDVHLLCTEHGSHLVGTVRACTSCDRTEKRLHRG